MLRGHRSSCRDGIGIGACWGVDPENNPKTQNPTETILLLRYTPPGNTIKRTQEFKEASEELDSLFGAFSPPLPRLKGYYVDKSRNGTKKM